MTRIGLAVLLDEQRSLISARRVGLVTQAAAVLPDLTGSVDALLAAGARLTALFGPEHGVSGAATAGDHIANAIDRRTGLPVYSLYGAATEPDADMMAEVDVLLFDMQDVGARFYTYISTLFYVLRGAAQAGKPVIVTDRPNPINGVSIEGPLIEPGYESFVGIAPLPIRHGLTIGEIARYLNETCRLGADLTIVPMRGWRRDDWFDQTGLPWAPTSPAMPHLSTATLYPGMCLLEGTNLSLGRGTALPFEICGAPWVDGYDLAERMNALDLPGARFRPLRFTPYAGPFAGEECGGVQAHVLDREALRPVALGLALVAELRAAYPRAFAWNAGHFDRLMGSAAARAAIDAGTPASAIAETWSAACEQFAEARRPLLQYA